MFTNHKSACDVMTDGHTTIFFGLLLERFLATRYVATYEHSSHRAGYLVACFSIVSALLLSFFKIRSFNMSERSIYCSSVTTETYTDVLITHSLLLVLLIIIVMIFTVIFFQNRRMTNR
ncbi:hypothetical protein ANCCAN_12028 [Ancylostoma caninum]|uniref:Uncharacterized protein n=1 Tax=Ancylostoma caninum TaxID=29170 RepID=A0A368GGS6_ANCCA|nr:hypothetical protein ANCCAN_12028 [Ancylostoma caninum]